MPHQVVQSYELAGIESIQPHPDNPHRWNLEAIAESIGQNGFYGAVIVQKSTGHILAGNHRWIACRDAGLSSIPVIFLDLTDSQARRVMLADNRTTDLATYDEPALADLLIACAAEEDQLLGTGYSEEALQALIDRVGSGDDGPPGGDGGGSVEQDIPPEPPKVAVTQPGDIYTLGDHRLICGSCTNGKDVARLMRNDHAVLCATDPPYLVNYTGKRIQGSGKDWSEHYKDPSLSEGPKFLREAFALAIQYTTEHAPFYCWHADKRHTIFSEAWKECDILEHQHIIWMKKATILTQTFFLYQHEPCMFGWKKGKGTPKAKACFNEYSTVWQIDYDEASKSGNREHPTVKPLEIFARPIRLHTVEGDICYEPFAGSGSQLIAAEQLGRRVFAIEIEPIYCDVIVKRWSNLTGKKARRQKASRKK